ncbi:retrotransposon protein, putative, ty1-copia subclass [Tanacetum coccineum]|uniref:Retrotransposon protein, putative, ty1-copia subclass n=1 Tax=Tanacetum coccineum TaxID=301880 RepID=A0ABQ4Y1Y8_9ASTR
MSRLYRFIVGNMKAAYYPGCLVLNVMLQQGLFGIEFSAAARAVCKGCLALSLVLQQGLFGIEFNAAAGVFGNAVYDAHNEVACLMLGKGKPVGPYAIKVKGYVEKLERLGYVLPQDLSVVMAIQGGRIQKANKKSLNAKGKGKGKGKGKDKILAQWNTVYDAHNEVVCLMLGSMTPELHGQLENSSPYEMLQEAKSILGNKMELRVMAIQGGRIQKANKKSLNSKGKVSKNDVLYFNAIPSNGIYEIDMSNLMPNVNSIYNVSNKRVKHNLDSTYLWHCRFAHISKKRIEKLQHDGILKSADDEFFDQCVSNLSGKMTRKSFPYRPERTTDLFGLIHTDDYALESDARILNMVPTKKVDKTPYELWYGKVSKLS